MTLKATSRTIEPRNKHALVAGELRSPLRVLKDHITFAEMESGISNRHWAAIRRQIGNLEDIIAELSRMERIVTQRVAKVEGLPRN